MTEEEHDAEARRLRAETAHLEAQTEKLRAQTNFKLQAGIAHLVAQSEKARCERAWIPPTILAGVIVAIMEVVPRLME